MAEKEIESFVFAKRFCVFLFSRFLRHRRLVVFGSRAHKDSPKRNDNNIATIKRETTARKSDFALARRKINLSRPLRKLHINLLLRIFLFIVFDFYVYAALLCLSLVFSERLDLLMPVYGCTRFPDIMNGTRGE